MNICNFCGYTFETEAVLLDTPSAKLKFCCESCKERYKKEVRCFDDFEVGEIVVVYSRFCPFKAKILEVKPTRVRVQFLNDGRIRWRKKSEIRKVV